MGPKVPLEIQSRLKTGTVLISKPKYINVVTGPSDFSSLIGMFMSLQTSSKDDKRSAQSFVPALPAKKKSSKYLSRLIYFASVDTANLTHLIFFFKNCWAD